MSCDSRQQAASGGLTSNRHEDAISLANGTNCIPAETAHVAVISMDSDPAKIFQLDDSQGPEKIKLFSMLISKKVYTI